MPLITTHIVAKTLLVGSSLHHILLTAKEIDWAWRSFFCWWREEHLMSEIKDWAVTHALQSQTFCVKLPYIIDRSISWHSTEKHPLRLWHLHMLWPQRWELMCTILAYFICTIGETHFKLLLLPFVVWLRRYLMVMRLVAENHDLSLHLMHT